MANIEAFTGRADAYTKARPGYPEEALKYIRTLAPFDAVIADIGAGTGILTVLLAQYGFKVYAVEPNADMREQLAISCKPYPNIEIVDGTAEATTLPDNCIDIITNAQALRRFDIALFRAECIRISKSNPIVVTVFNGGTDVSTGYEEALGALYNKPDVKKYPNPLMFSHEKWLLYHLSMEGVPFEGEPGYDSYTAELIERYDRENVDGILRINEMTYVYSEKLYKQIS